MREELEYKEVVKETPLLSVLGMEEPVLVTKAKNVNEKLYLASQLQKLDTIGTDAVVLSVNDMLAMRVKPVAFSDTILCARAGKEQVKRLRRGVEQGCTVSGIRYAGGQVDELPEAMSFDRYYLFGYITGVAERRERMETPQVKDGDVIIGIASNGLHNDGYALAAKKLYLNQSSMEAYYETLGATLGELLLAPVRLYKRAMEAVYASGQQIKGCVQVAEGGLDAAVYQLLSHRAGAVIKQKQEHIPPLYKMLQRDGGISSKQLRESCNMGIGMLILVQEENADAVIELLEGAGETVTPLGLVERDSYTVRYIT